MQLGKSKTFLAQQTKQASKAKMFCVTWWCSVKIAKGVQGFNVTDGFKLDVVSKLSNTVLGCIHVDTKLCLMKRLQDMQLQAACLMRHATRFPRDVFFWLDDKELLPRNFAYKTKLEEQEEARINELLEQAKQPSIGRISILRMMWNDDDAWAEQQTSSLVIQIRKDTAWIVCRQVALSSVSKSLLHLENKGVTKWGFVYDSQTAELVRHLGFLREACACQQVVINAFCGYNIQKVRSTFSGPKLQVLLHNLP